MLNGRHQITADDGLEIEAQSVIAATGAFSVPIIPAFAGDLDPSVRQMHSADYRHPGQLPPGPVLVVGAGTAGADIAVELAAGHDVRLAGRHTGSVPVALARSRVVRRLVLARRIPPGRLGRLVQARDRRDGRRTGGGSRPPYPGWDSSACRGRTLSPRASCPACRPTPLRWSATCRLRGEDGERRRPGGPGVGHFDRGARHRKLQGSSRPVG
ncbi:NAD(P)-binding domain-containing protein [Actinoplanes sp. NPDC049598]|uniref:NAD(P)-binding domain-containing protein n=1 Tax=Actinoplanes sp. NPDC049598 TaxID=3154626 RepID=UPI003438CB49